MSGRPMRVLSVTSGRADVSILAPVWRAFAEAADMDLHVFATGAHVSDVQSVKQALPQHVTLHVAGADLGGAAAPAAAEAMAEIQRAAGRTIAGIKPDLLFLIGDRLDMIPAALAAVPFNLAMAHLHGGEITEGAVDDRLRHAITKLSHIHLASCVPAALRLAAMGEEPWRITVTGAPGLDTLRLAPLLSREDFAASIGMDTIEGLVLVTVHPETNADSPGAPLDAVLKALDARPAPTLITGTNADPGGLKMRRLIEDFVTARPRVRFVESLGPERYASALRHARVMLGNSSSGIVEAEFAGLPVIDVGDRQAGRDRGHNVVSVGSDPAAVLRALYAPPARRSEGRSLYGDGHAAPRIVEAIRGAMKKADLLRKHLHTGAASFDAPWARPDKQAK
jgi:UDP-hydrolysing UDP-N-acetyl-D-glucosamine 2-epimerase